MGGLDASAPIPGFETPEVFTNTVEFGQFFRRLIPMFVALLLFVWLLIGLVLAGGAGLGGVGWVLAAVLAAGVGYVLYAAKKRQFEATWSTSRLEVSPSGVVSVDR